MQAACDSLFICSMHSLTPPLCSQPSSFLRLTRFLTFNFTSFDKNELPQPFHTASARIHILHFRQSGASKASQSLPGSGLYRELVHEDPLSIPVHPISVFANSTIETPQQLAQAALSVSLYKALQTRTFMLKVAKELKAMKSKDYQAVKDCLDQIGDSVDRLSQSVRELYRLEHPDAAGGDGVFWLISNVETWVSFAMTDARTCVDELPGKKVNKLKAVIMAKVLNVEQTASNALALFHRYAAKYKP